VGPASYHKNILEQKSKDNLWRNSTIVLITSEKQMFQIETIEITKLSFIPPIFCFPKLVTCFPRAYVPLRLMPFQLYHSSGAGGRDRKTLMIPML